MELFSRVTPFWINPVELFPNCPMAMRVSVMYQVDHQFRLDTGRRDDDWGSVNERG